MANEADAQEVNPLAMSDEEFLNSMTSAPASTEEAPAEVAAQQETPADPAPAETPVEKPAEAKADPAEPAKEADPAPAQAADPVGSAEGEAAEGGEKPEAVAEGEAPNYEEFFKQVMTPFKANGKMVELKTPEEAIQLMQMGANYTRKMQELVPHRKVLTMLQNNGLLDESKLSFFIDLDKKDPEAIKKLIKDSGIDPLEIDTSAEPAYLEGNHRVSDEEVNFSAALEELVSTPEGKETLQVINDSWDQASKDLLWKHPETMATIQAQRDVGIYDRIAAEIDRQKTLGKLPPGMPFIQAYTAVGDQLTKADAFADLREKHQQGNAPVDPATPPGPEEKKAAPQAVATRVVPPKSPVTNSEAASAASQTRATPKQAEEFVNPLAMSDDDFLKKFEGRL